MIINERKEFMLKYKDDITPKQLKSTGIIRDINISDLYNCEKVNIRLLDREYSDRLAKTTCDSNITNKNTIVIYCSKNEKYCIVDGQHIVEKERINGATKIKCEILSGDVSFWETRAMASNTSGLWNHNKEPKAGNKLNHVADRKGDFKKYIGKGNFIEWYLDNYNVFGLKPGTVKKYSAWISKLDFIDRGDQDKRTFLRQCYEFELKHNQIKYITEAETEDDMMLEMKTIRDNPHFNRALRMHIDDSENMQTKIMVKKSSHELLKDTILLRRMNDCYREKMDIVAEAVKYNFLSEEELENIYSNNIDFLFDQIYIRIEENKKSNSL